MVELRDDWILDADVKMKLYLMFDEKITRQEAMKRLLDFNSNLCINSYDPGEILEIKKVYI